MPTLMLIKSPGNSTPQRTYPLTAENVVIGRDETCDVVVPNHAVSRRHAQVTKANGSYVLHDLNSRNHTYLNGKEVSGPIPLQHDDRIKICDYQYVYQDEKNAAPVRPPLPKNFGGPPSDEVESPGSVDNIEHTLSTRSATELLESQPSDKLRALLEISVELSKSFELDTLFEKIAVKMLDVFKQADRCFLIQLTGEKDLPVDRVVKTRRAAAPGDDHRSSRTIVRKSIQTLQAVVSDDASNDVGLGAAQSIVEFRIRSVMCVPLVADGAKPIGAIQVDTQDRGKKFKKDDLELLTIIANLCAVAIDKARLVQAQLEQAKQQNEIELAKKVQTGFLPQHAPQLPGYEFYGFYSAAQTVGGDYYDYIPLPDGRLAVVLGDVAGKGVPASLLMAKLSAEARFCMLTQSDPAKAISLLNDNLIRGGIGDRYVTLTALVLDPATHKVTVVNAGHLYPMRLVAKSGALSDAIGDPESGIPVGWVQGFEYTKIELSLEPGEHLLVYTDGVTDAMAPSGDMFGSGGIIMALGGPPDQAVKPSHIGERLVSAVRKHANGRPQNDDIAVVCFGRLYISPNDTGAPSLPLPLKGT